jgi:SAM-dependent methyltransferase
MASNPSDLYPDFFARFYDLIYAKIRLGVDTEYFLRKIRESKGPVLEVGVGTGRLFTQAISGGADIYGIDISPSMIKVLKARLAKKYHNRVSVQDILDFETGKKFSLIMAPFRVFMHLTEISDQVNALDHVYKNLLPGGQFIFDLFVPDPNLLAKGLNNVVDFEGEYEPGETIRRITTSSPDTINQIMDVTMRFEWTEKGKLNSGTWNTKMRFFFRFELEYLLKQSSFRNYTIFGDYKEAPLHPGSKEFIVVCRK